jgi:hypothetical protein
MHTAKSIFAECQNKGTRQNTSLPSARKKHSAKTYFAVCFCLPSVFYLALGKHGLCRVPDKIHSAKPPALGKSPVSGSDGMDFQLTKEILKWFVDASGQAASHIYDKCV